MCSKISWMGPVFNAGCALSPKLTHAAQRWIAWDFSFSLFLNSHSGLSLSSEPHVPPVPHVHPASFTTHAMHWVSDRVTDPRRCRLWANQGLTPEKDREELITLCNVYVAGVHINLLGTITDCPLVYHFFNSNFHFHVAHNKRSDRTLSSFLIPLQNLLVYDQVWLS